ncbi:MAG: tetratricopeptide repeat protein [Candidatus Latescibacteria bacterium]|nr:tetratricopeptide repeat protein [Candidatus Latescibacterota bacterium]
MRRIIIIINLLACLMATLSYAQAPVDQNYLKAQRFEQQGDFEKARDLYEFLYKTQNNDQYFWRLMLVYDRLHEYKKMKELALARLKTRPNELTTMRYLSRAYYGEGDSEKGREIILNMIGNDWTDIGKISYAAGELYNRNELDTAIWIYKTARKKTGQSNLFASDLARIFMMRFEYPEAISEYLKTLESVEISYANIESVIKDALETGISADELSKPLAEYLQQKPDSILAARLLSGLKYQTGDYRNAYRIIADTAVLSKNPKDVWDLAEKFYTEGHLDEALIAYEDFYRLYPDLPVRVRALKKSAAIKAGRGDREGARTDYIKLTNDFSGTEEAADATLRILEFTKDETSFEGFTATLEEYASTSPYPGIALDAYVLLADTYMTHGLSDEARQALANARIKARDKQEIYKVAVKTALFDFFAVDIESMNREIEAAVNLNASGQDINNLLSLKMLGMQCMTDAEKSGYSAFAHGEYAVFRGDFKEAVDSLTVAAGDTTSVVASVASVSLARLYRGNGDMKEANAWYLKAVSAARDTTERVAAIIDAADFQVMELNDVNSAKSLYLDAITSYPGTVHDSYLRRKLRQLTEQ